MKPVIVFLEKYAQWLALALGGLFCAFMVWSYVFHNPLTTNIQDGAQQLAVTPGTIDQKIADTSAQRLDSAINATHPDFTIPVPQIVMDINTATVHPEIKFAYDGNVFPIGLPGQDIVAQNPGGQVAVLPTLPKLQYVDSEPTRTVFFKVPDANGISAHMDADVITTFWKLPTKDLQKGFDDAFGSKLLAQDEETLFVRATLISQQQTGPNTWGPDVVVAAPVDIPLPQNIPAKPVAYPPDGPDPDQIGAQYKDWALREGVQQYIVAAPFPPVAVTNTSANLQWQPLDVWIAERAKEAAADAAPVVDVVATPAPAANPPRTSQRPAPAPPATPAPAVAPVIKPTIPVVDSGEAELAAVKLMAPVPASHFNPIQLVLGNPNPMLLHFHDFTAEPGKTYHYKVRYTLLNPLYKKYAKVSDSKLADQFGIDSPDSDWSAAMTVPTRTRFWCAAHQPSGVALGQGEVNFTVFTWHDGMWQRKEYAVVAGDEIGGNEDTTGNFFTHWTVLDVSKESDLNNRYALLVPDDGGDADRRNVMSDSTSVEFKKFERMVNAQQPNQAAVAPGPGGPVAGGPGAFPPGVGPGTPPGGGTPAPRPGRSGGTGGSGGGRPGRGR